MFESILSELRQLNHQLADLRTLIRSVPAETQSTAAKAASKRKAPAKRKSSNKAK